MLTKVAVIGECMLELSQLASSSDCSTRPMEMSFGGDTLNTAIYLSRNDIPITYVTGLGDDPNSDWLISQWQKENIDCSLIERMPGNVPGMYMIDIDDSGERSFYYWRKNSPASRLFDDQDNAAKLFSKLNEFSYLYLSGISLAILPQNSLIRLFEFIQTYRQQGGQIIFDGNYRPRLWKNVDAAQEAYQKMYQMTDIALPTLEDEALLFGYDSAELLIDVIKDHGVDEIVVKMGGEGCLSYYNEITEYVAATPTNPVDTTAAGDSFNAGYLAERIKGSSAVDACRSGHALASKVIQHRGAIIPHQN